MTEVFFETLFTGRIIFLMLLTLGVGYTIGLNGIRAFGLIALSLAFMFVQQAILFLSPAVDGLIRIGETGAGGFDASKIVVTHMIFHLFQRVLVELVDSIPLSLPFP